MNHIQRTSSNLCARTYLWTLPSRSFSYLKLTSSSTPNIHAVNSKNKSLQNVKIQQRNFSNNEIVSTTFQNTNNMSDDVFVQFFINAFQALNDSKMTTFFADSFVFFHENSGLPWWMAILIGTGVLRALVFFPIQISGQRVAGRRKKAFQELEEDIVPNIKRKLINDFVNERGLTPKDFSQYFKPGYSGYLQFVALQNQIKRDQIIKYNCSTSKIFFPIYCQIPIWISISMSVRKLCQNSEYEHIKLQLIQGGSFLMPDLTLPVETLTMPILLGSLWFLSLKVFDNQNKRIKIRGKKAKVFKVMEKIVIRGLILWIVYLSTKIESGVTLYWVGSASVGLISNLILMSPKFRNSVGIMRFDEDPDKPYQLLKENIVLDWKDFVKTWQGRFDKLKPSK